MRILFLVAFWLFPTVSWAATVDTGGGGGTVQVTPSRTQTSSLTVTGSNPSILLQHTGGDQYGWHTEASGISYMKNDTDNAYVWLMGSDDTLHLGHTPGTASNVPGLRIRTSGTGATESVTVLDGDGANIFNLLDNGNLGIGSGAASVRLVVGANASGNESIQLNSFGFARIFINGDTDNDGSEVGSPCIAFNEDGGTLTAAQDTVSKTNVAGQDGCTTATTNALSNGFIIRGQSSVQIASDGAVIATFDGGNIGIGATTPENLLEVQGAEATDAVIVLDADDGDDAADTWSLESEAADNDLSFVNGTTENFALTSGGNVSMPVAGSTFTMTDEGWIGLSSTTARVQWESTSSVLELCGGSNNCFTWNGLAIGSGSTGNRDIGSTSDFFDEIFVENIIHDIPSAETIASGGTVTANACGTIKLISSAGAVTTDTTNTFTAPAAGNEGCCMNVCNSGANSITLDNNANFKSAGAADIVVGADDCLQVCSTGASGVWYQVSALVAN